MNPKTIVFLLSLVAYPAVSAGVLIRVASDSTDFSATTSVLRIFIDCTDCDKEYLRNNTTFVDHVRDPNLAQVHLHITNEQTASRGLAYKLDFIGRDDFEGQDLNLAYAAAQSYTDSRIRDDLLKIIHMGLSPYLSQTTSLDDIEVEITTAAKGISEGEANDPWNAWIFSLESTGEYDGEESTSDLELRNTVRAERITDDWKIMAHIHHDLEIESFKENSKTVTSTLRSLNYHGSMTRSMGNHISIGAFTEAVSSSYRNINLGYSITPAIEYNFFPWSESDVRMLTIAYTAGFRAFDYNEITIYDKTSEALLFEQLSLDMRLIRPWGELEIGLEGSHYIKDFEMNKLEFDFKTAYRITKGLALTLRFDRTSIHDQLNLAAEEATDEEIYLRRKQLATTFDIEINFGIEYTFGSIYNNIVNRRLD